MGSYHSEEENFEFSKDVSSGLNTDEGKKGGQMCGTSSADRVMI